MAFMQTESPFHSLASCCRLDLSWASPCTPGNGSLFQYLHSQQQSSAWRSCRISDPGLWPSTGSPKSTIPSSFWSQCRNQVGSREPHWSSEGAHWPWVGRLLALICLYGSPWRDLGEANLVWHQPVKCCRFSPSTARFAWAAPCFRS